MSDIRILEDFLDDNKELELLEDYIKGFNIFEVIGMVTQEIKPSHFLAWLLNPAKHELIPFNITTTRTAFTICSFR